MFWLPIDRHLVVFVGNVFAHRFTIINGFAKLIKISNFEFSTEFDLTLLRSKVTQQ